MAVEEINSVKDAKERLNAFFKDIPEGDVDGYAKIAFALSNTNLLMPGLNMISKGIWEEYNKEEFAHSHNRFTGAIIRYAQTFGFSCQDNVVFTGPLTEDEFLSYVKEGVLWKDTFAPEHGEFSHTLQWLAAGAVLRLGDSTAELYKGSGKYHSTTALWTRENGNPIKKNVPLWAWLVDCFPAETAPESLDGKANIFSDRGRVPNIITKIAMNRTPKNSDDPQGWFIGLYVHARQTITLKDAYKNGKAPNVYEKRPGRPKSERKRIQAIKSFQTAHYQKLSEEENGSLKWTPAGEVENIETVSGKAKSVQRVFSRAPVKEPTQKETVEIRLHGTYGDVPQRIVAPSLIK